jgi:hypothetical protein
MDKIIVVIGAGQLGSRHLQGIAQSSFDILIEVVEPYEASRKTAEERYNQIENKSNVKSIAFIDTIDKLSDNIDLVIIATSADVRFKVIEELLSAKNIKNLVLEKVLFQTVEEYYSVEKLLKSTNTECWVNHPRRMFPIYNKLKLKLQEAKEISYNFQGGDWGLGCNGLHFIDHLSYLSDSTSISLDNKFLNDTIYNSKRKGFVEFNGLLAGQLDSKYKFSLYSSETTSPSVHTIVSDVLVAKIDESKGEILLYEKKNNWELEIITTKIIYFQSELSNILIEDILVKNKCMLPSYKEAMDLHIPYIECLLEKMNKINGQNNKICPIT